MERFLRIGVALVALLLPAGAAAEYFPMPERPQRSGYRATITSAYGTGDFLYARAEGYLRGAFTQATALEGALYLCEVRDADSDSDGDLSDEALCTSVRTLSATDTNFEIKAGREWLLFDITTAETSGTSYLTLKGHYTQASGGGSTAPILASDYGVVAGVQSNQAAAVNSAIAAAAAAGGGTVMLPDGIIYLGETGANRFYSGIQITQSDIHLRCETFQGCELRPLFNHGGTLLSVCPAFTNTPNYGGNKDCTAASDLDNVTIEGIKFFDDDPTAHCNSYSAATGQCGSEETHAVFVSDCTSCAARYNVVDSMGDEGIVWKGDGGIVFQNELINTPSIRGGSPLGGGSSLEIEANDVLVSQNVVRGIQADPQGDGGACSTDCQNRNGAITLSTSGVADISRVQILDNRIYDIDAWYGILVSSSGAALSDVRISGNTVEMLNVNVATDCEETPTYNPGTTVDAMRCAIAFGGTAVGSLGVARDKIVVEGNTFGGTVLFPSVGLGALGSVIVRNNIIGGDALNANGPGLIASGNPLTIEGNTISGFGSYGIYLIALDDDDGTNEVVIRGNSISEVQLDGTGATANDVITMFNPGSNPCGTDGVIVNGIRMENNVIIGNGDANTTDRMVEFNVCALASSSNDYVDMADSGDSGSFGMTGFADMRGTTLKNTNSYPIVSSIDGAVYVGNRFEHNGERVSLTGSDVIFNNNLMVDITTRSADLTGQRPTCIGNKVRNTASAFDYPIFCGTTGSGAGCGADVAADGVCDLNTVCNSGDTDC